MGDYLLCVQQTLKLLMTMMARFSFSVWEECSARDNLKPRGLTKNHNKQMSP